MAQLPGDADAGDDPVRAALHEAAVRRLEAEQDERLAALDALRDRDLRAVAAELAARGEDVEVGLADRRLRGPLLALGSDWLAVDTVGGEVDVALGACLWMRSAPADDPGPAPVAPAGTAGPTGQAAARTFRARLAELELAGTPVELGTVGGALELAGRLVAAARDHVVLRTADGGLWQVAQIAWVRPAADRGW